MPIAYDEWGTAIDSYTGEAIVGPGMEGTFGPGGGITVGKATYSPRTMDWYQSRGSMITTGPTSLDPNLLPGPMTPPVMEAGTPLLLGPAAVGGGVSLLSKLIPWITKAMPWLIGGATGYQIAEGMQDMTIPGMQGGTMVPTIPGSSNVLQGPGAMEPYPQMIVKEWAGIGGSRFYLLINGRVAVRKANGVWKLIKRPRMLHMKVSNPRMGDVVKADRIVNRTAKILRKRLSPAAKRR